MAFRNVMSRQGSAASLRPVRTSEIIQRPVMRRESPPPIKQSNPVKRNQQDNNPMPSELFNSSGDIQSAPKGETYQPANDFEGRIDAAISPSMSGVVGGEVANAGMKVAMARASGVPSNMLGEVAATSLKPTMVGVGSMIGGGILDAIAGEQVKQGYGDLLGGLTDEDVNKYESDVNAGVNDFAKQGSEVATNNRVEMPGSYSTSEKSAMSLDREARQQAKDRTRGIIPQVGSLLGFDEKPTILDEVVPSTELARRMTEGNSAPLGQETDAFQGRPGIFGTDIALDAPHGVGHFGSYDPGLVKVGADINAENRVDLPAPKTSFESFIDTMLSLDPSRSKAMMHSPTAREYNERRANKLEPLFGGRDFGGRDSGGGVNGGGRAGNAGTSDPSGGIGGY